MKNLMEKIRTGLQRYCKLSNQFPIAVFSSVFILGVLVWGAFNTAMELTNSETFCISCHEMENNVYQEYKETMHYENRTGVRATCPDCHVPKDWVHMFARKIRATNELYHKIIGSIDTPEKFKAKRLQLAEYVWKEMKDSDSRECRNCHDFTYMNLGRQKGTSRRAHKRAIENNLTCIDCHMGIAHHMAEDFDQDGVIHDKFKQEKRPCTDCHSGMAQSDDW